MENNYFIRYSGHRNDYCTVRRGLCFAILIFSIIFGSVIFTISVQRINEESDHSENFNQRQSKSKEGQGYGGNITKETCKGSARNVALNKPVTLSSLYKADLAATKGSYAVDGNFHYGYGQVAHTGYEKRPWLMISLENMFTIEKVVIYNRRDNWGWWLHDVEIRVGQTKYWDQMSTCGTLLGASETGLNHTVVCQECLPGKYVTLKIMEDNNVTSTRSDGLNTFVVSEIDVFGKRI